MYAPHCITPHSLGNSLMRDLLTDISGPESADNDMFSTLATLEQELDSKEPNGNGNANDNNNSNGPPGMHVPSAGAMVVGHAHITAVTPTNTRYRNTATDDTGTGTGSGSTYDAFSLGLQQFSALSLAEDFLKADSIRKETAKNTQDVTDDLVNNLFEEDEEYDVQQDLVLNKAQGGDQMKQLFPGFGAKVGVQVKQQGQQQQGQQQQGQNTGTPQPLPQVRGPNGPPIPPPHLMHGPPHGHPQHNMMQHGRGMPPQPHMMQHGLGSPPPVHHHGRGPPPSPHGMPHGGPMTHGMPHGGPGMHPPPHHMMMMQMQMQRQHMMQQQAMHANGNDNQGREGNGNTNMNVNANSNANVNVNAPPPGPHTLQKQNPQQETQTHPVPSQQKEVFAKSDFPALGADASETEKERREEQIEKKRQASKKKPTIVASSVKSNTIPVRTTFHNPSPSAAPVPASAIHCTSMTSRDLCYVLHSMLRPVLSHSSVLDAYNADYYRWSYDDRKSRNLLFLGGNAPTKSNLPNPVWKETKVKALQMEHEFRDKVEKRADTWMKEKQALGRVVKVNVKRPRALLATGALSSSGAGSAKKDLDSAEVVAKTEEDRQRAFLWAGRVAIDQGFQAYLSLVELRRLLQSRPGDALSGEDSVVDRREELLKDVEENVSKLQGTFGLKKSDGGIECDDKILARTLTLPKGRMLLSRVVDEGILPHPSACKVLPNAIKVVFDSASTGDLAATPPAGEDRLLRSLTGLVKTEHPSVDPANLLQCLMSTITAETVINGEKRSMKAVLTSKRTLMELLYGIFSRGGEVCVGGFQADWKDKETKFLAILSAS